MKVGTDSILLGAWLRAENPLRILDIGTGTGILALMMAQRFSNSLIDAVETSIEAIADAKANFEYSPWNSSINLHNLAIQHFQPEVKYDLIVSNPPFFPHDQVARFKNPDAHRHTSTLPFSELARISAQLLTADGQFSLVLPHREGGTFIEVAAEEGLYLSRECLVKPKPAKAANRRLLTFTKSPNNSISREEFVIYKEAQGTYSEAFKSLTTDFYL